MRSGRYPPAPGMNHACLAARGAPPPPRERFYGRGVPANCVTDSGVSNEPQLDAVAEVLVLLHPAFATAGTDDQALKRRPRPGPTRLAAC
jgi:hypothetical protein